MHPRWSSRTTPSTAASSRACTSSGGWAAAGMAGSTEAHVRVLMHLAQPLVGRVPCAGSQQLSFAGLSPAIRDSAYVALRPPSFLRYRAGERTARFAAALER